MREINDAIVPLIGLLEPAAQTNVRIKLVSERMKTPKVLSVGTTESVHTRKRRVSVSQAWTQSRPVLCHFVPLRATEWLEKVDFIRPEACGAFVIVYGIVHEYGTGTARKMS